jgi:hypothetical protein
MEKLYYAAKLFQNEGDGGLEGSRTACRAMVDFIGVRHENPELAAPFIAIAEAFSDLEAGVPPPLFSTSIALRHRSRSSRVLKNTLAARPLA